MSIVMEYASEIMHIGGTNDILVLVVNWQATSLILMTRERVSSKVSGRNCTWNLGHVIFQARMLSNFGQKNIGGR